MKGKTSGRIDDIEILRGIAVLMVVIHHAKGSLFTWNTPMLKLVYTYFGGDVGVDLFFAISGFVIARDLIPRLAKTADTHSFLIETTNFWIRRFWRLIPSAWLWLFIILLASLFFNSSTAFGPFKINFEGTISAILNVANLHLMYIFGGEAGANFHYWTLSLEEQFYILLPFLIFLSGRWLPHVLIFAVILQVFSERGLWIIMRTDAMLLGVLIALWCKKSSYQIFEPLFLKNNKVVKGFSILFLLGCLWSVGADKLKIIPLHVGLTAILSAIIVLVASYDKGYILGEGILKRLLLWVGSRSYAIYLIHIPAFFFTQELWFRLAPQGTVFNNDFFYKYLITATILIIVAADLNYRLLENPLRKRGRKIAANRMVYHQSKAPQEQELAHTARQSQKPDA